MPKVFDLINQRFGHWVVIARAESRGGDSYWQCQCDCGNTGVVRGKALKYGRSLSCGCVDGKKREHRKPVRRVIHELLQALQGSGLTICECGKVCLDVSLDDLKALALAKPRPTHKRYFGVKKAGSKKAKKTERLQRLDGNSTGRNQYSDKTGTVNNVNSSLVERPSGNFKAATMIEDELLQRPKGGANNPFGCKGKEDGINDNNINIDSKRTSPVGTSKAATIHKTKKTITRFGDWDVVSKDGNKWTIECRNCGHQIIRSGSYVRTLKVKCPACNPDYDPRGRKPNDPDVTRVHLSPGTRFGRLFVSEYLGVNDQEEQIYLCSCLCGNSLNATRNDLETSAITDCGCQK